jgi:hypothetical protein
MDPYLEELAARLEGLRERAEIEEAMDKLEYLYEVLDDGQQEVASQLLATLARRLEGLGRGG